MHARLCHKSVECLFAGDSIKIIRRRLKAKKKECERTDICLLNLGTPQEENLVSRNSHSPGLQPQKRLLCELKKKISVFIGLEHYFFQQSLVRSFSRSQLRLFSLGSRRKRISFDFTSLSLRLS